MAPLSLLVLSDPKARHLKTLDRLLVDVETKISLDPAELREWAPRADVILNASFQGELLGELLDLTTRVRWVHSLFTGVETLLAPAVVASPVPLTNARGVFRVPLAEWATLAMLFFAYDVRRILRQQAERAWKPFDIETLAGATLGVVGYGSIGAATAERAKAFGMRVLALRRRRPELAGADPIVDEAVPAEKLDDLMAASDYVVVATPLTKATRGLVGERQIAAMKPTGVLVNVGRGACVDEAALVRALQEQRIRGAALDVFEVEPLPAASPLWGLENVLLSPHSADHVKDFLDLGYEAFFTNLAHFRAGESLEWVVDKQAGY